MKEVSIHDRWLVGDSRVTRMLSATRAETAVAVRRAAAAQTHRVSEGDPS